MKEIKLVASDGTEIGRWTANTFEEYQDDTYELLTPDGKKIEIIRGVNHSIIVETTD